jgi:Protein of unknown function (DUF2462)
LASDFRLLSQNLPAGRLDKPVKRPQLKKQSNEDKELTKAINAGNESRVAGVAASSGGKLSVLKAPIAATATADQKNKSKGAKMAKPMRPGMAFGASSK